MKKFEGLKYAEWLLIRVTNWNNNSYNCRLEKESRKKGKVFHYP